MFIGNRYATVIQSIAQSIINNSFIYFKNNLITYGQKVNRTKKCKRQYSLQVELLVPFRIERCRAGFRCVPLLWAEYVHLCKRIRQTFAHSIIFI